MDTNQGGSREVRDTRGPIQRLRDLERGMEYATCMRCGAEAALVVFRSGERACVVCSLSEGRFVYYSTNNPSSEAALRAHQVRRSGRDLGFDERRIR